MANPIRIAPVTFKNLSILICKSTKPNSERGSCPEPDQWRREFAPLWFLNGRADVRSSYFLEEVGTEFDVQGLELDWTEVCWDADFTYEDGNLHHYKFRGHPPLKRSAALRTKTAF